MPGKQHGPSIKNPDQYEAMREDGMSKEKAARISNANAQGNGNAASKRGGKAENLEERTVAELRSQAKELEITGRSDMSKDQLIRAIRGH